MFDYKKGVCNCERCGHFWETQFSEILNKYVAPKSCAKCKSKYWNQPRTYGGNYLDGLAPMAKRFKPTGRKAASLRPEIIAKERRNYLIQNVFDAVREYKRIMSNAQEMKETGEINDRYESGRVAWRNVQHDLNSADKDILFWINKLAEFDGISERDADAFNYYERNKQYFRLTT